MVLSDRTIKEEIAAGRLVIDPYDESLVQPSSAAGLVDPGFEGNLTLELSNLANLPITIYQGMPIGQISFMRMDVAVEHAYGAGEAGRKNHGQTEAAPSRFYP